MLRTAFFVFVISASTAFGGVLPPIVETKSVTKTRAFAGLNWTFGSGGGPEAVLGVARVKTKTDGNAHGAKASVHLPLSNGISFGKVKVSGLFGKHDRMGEIGLGFNSTTSSALMTAGIWAPYVNGGVDFDFNGGFNGYAGINSLKKWSVPKPQPLNFD